MLSNGGEKNFIYHAFAAPFNERVGTEIGMSLLTGWVMECTSCRTEVFKFIHQRILTQHLANYCCVVSIHRLIVITSYRASKLDLDKNQSVRNRF